MIVLPEIDAAERSHDGQREHLTLRFAVPASTPYFEGHFPEVPLLPGVVQIGWAVAFGRQYFELSSRFHSLMAVKFMRVIQPGASVSLKLWLDDGALSFAFDADGHACSSGRVHFH